MAATVHCRVVELFSLSYVEELYTGVALHVYDGLAILGRLHFLALLVLHEGFVNRLLVNDVLSCLQHDL